MLPQCLSALGPTRPVTLFTFVVLLSCIVFSFFGLCLKKLQPRRPSSYQVSMGSHLTHSLTPLYPLLASLGCLCCEEPEVVPGCPPSLAGDPQSIASSWPPSSQMSDQSDSAFNDVERSSVSSTPNSNVSTPPQPCCGPPTSLPWSLTFCRPPGAALRGHRPAGA